MKHFTILLTLAVLLSGCTKNTPVSDTLAENAINATTALEKALPEECKTDFVTTQFAVIKTEIRATKNACDVEKDVITKEKLKWQWGFWILVAVIGAYIGRKILK